MAVVTARDLSRRTRELLDRIERDEKRILVVRANHPVAVIEPVSARFLNAVVDEGPPPEIPPEDLPPIPTDSLQRKILLMYSDRRVKTIPTMDEGFGAVALAVGRLEIARLMRRTGPGYRITREGSGVVELMQAEGEN